MKKFTFKNEFPAGRYGSFFSKSVDIKLEKKSIGTINEDRGKSLHERISVRIMVEDLNEKCGWKWITFKKKFETFEEAKQWLTGNSEKIQTMYKLHQLN